jgi:hypothetical protein
VQRTIEPALREPGSLLYRLNILRETNDFIWSCGLLVSLIVFSYNSILTWWVLDPRRDVFKEADWFLTVRCGHFECETINGELLLSLFGQYMYFREADTKLTNATY